MTNESEASSPAPTDGPPSSSSPARLSGPFWREPERVLAVVCACLLRLMGLLGEEWTAAVMLTALGAPFTQLIATVARRRLGKGGN